MKINTARRKLFFLLLTGFFYCVIPLASSYADTITVYPLFDTMVSQSNPSTSYGNIDLMTATISPRTYSVFHFDFSDIPSGSTINSATLVLTEFGGGGSGSINLNNYSTWIELTNDLSFNTFNNYMVSHYSIDVQYGPINGSNTLWYFSGQLLLDYIDNYVNDPPSSGEVAIRGLYLRSDSGAGRTFRTKEVGGADRPRIVVNYTPPSTITLNSPDGGESWQRGNSRDITWSSTGSPGSYVKIELYKGGSFNRTISSFTSNDGKYSWPISSSQAVGTDYQVEITSTSNSSYVDHSDSYFSITDLDVTSPNGGESWEAGTSHNVTWVSSNGTGSTVIIALYKNQAFVSEIAETSNDGTYSWAIPSNIQIGTDYKIRVWTTGGEDLSDGNFSIVAPTPSLTPDLVVQSPGVNDSTQYIGQSFTISATVKNQGSGTSSGTTLRYYRSINSTISGSDTPLGTDYVSSLSANSISSESVSVFAPGTAGTYWVGACVDSVSSESSTSNNCSTGVQVAVFSTPSSTAPDLIVQSPSVSDATLTPGQSFSASATVKNQGNDSSASTTLRYYSSLDSIISTGDSQISTDGVSALSSGDVSSESASVTSPTTTGTYWIGACVDFVSNESNTGNNCSTGVKITVSLTTQSDDFWTLMTPVIVSAANNKRPGASCGYGRQYDCSLKCISSIVAVYWIGDSYCDDGGYGVDLLCPTFQNDGGDCD